MKAPVRFTDARLSIRTRIAAVVVLAVSAYLVLDRWMGVRAYDAAFSTVESELAETALVRAQDGLADRTRDFGSFARTIALGHEVKESELRALGAHVVACVAADGRVRSAVYADPETRRRVLPAFPNESWNATHPLMRPTESGRLRAGLLTIAHRMFLFAAEPVDESQSEGSLVLVAEEIDQDRLAEILGSGVVAVTLDAAAGSPFASVDPLDLEPTILELTEETALLRGPLRDALGRPIGSLEVSAPAAAFRLRSSIADYELLSSVGVGLLFPLVLLMLLQAVVIGPLLRLERQVVAIGEADDASRRIGTPRRDEVGSLSNAFDALLGKLEASRRASLHVARMSGRADVAVDVAHSAGNVLNSISVTSQLARQRLASVQIEDLRAILDALEGERHDLQRFIDEDPRGQHLLPFFASTVDHLEEQLGSLSTETAEIETHVESVVGLLAKLRDTTDARDRGLRERCDASALVREVAGPLLQEAQIPAHFHCAEGIDPTIEVDEERVRDIVQALVENAVEALAATPPADRTVALQTSREGDAVQITIADNGCGFGDDVAPRLFEQGFSTRADEHAGGLGLHRAALMANELGGKLAVNSPGEGLGATAQLTLPAALVQQS